MLPFVLSIVANKSAVISYSDFDSTNNSLSFFLDSLVISSKFNLETSKVLYISHSGGGSGMLKNLI